MFDDILEANSRYASSFKLGGLDPTAARGLGVVTCIDSRIEPLAMLGLVPGDAKILRNAGARVSDDVLRSLVLATNLLGVDRICIVAHTQCRMADTSDEEIREALGNTPDAAAMDFLSIENQLDTLRADVALVRNCSLIPARTPVAGFVYDVASGLLARQLEI
ncbi:MAG: carbonic anhydrase [Actinomycetes bacterium]